MGKTLILPNQEEIGQGSAYFRFESDRIFPPLLASGACYSTGVLDPFINGMVTEPLAGGLQHLGMNESASQAAASGLSFIAFLELGRRGIANVQANRAAGNLFRDELATAMRAEGRTIDTEVYKWTPFGARYMDLDVWHQGVNLGGIETKVGRSRYLPLQKLKDAWLGANGYHVQLVRKPLDW